MTKLKKTPNMLTADSKALRKLCWMRMLCRDISHLWLKNKAHQMSWLSQHFPGMCPKKVSGNLGFMTSMLHHLIFIPILWQQLTISHLDVTDTSGAMEIFKLLPSVCAAAGLDTKTSLAASYKASGFNNGAIMEKIPFFQGQGMAAVGKFGRGHLCRARVTLLVMLQAFVNYI